MYRRTAPRQRVLSCPNSSKGLRHLRTQFLAQDIDRDVSAVARQVPKGPAIAACGALNGSPHLMDRTSMVGGNQGTVGTDFGGPAVAMTVQDRAWLKQTAFDEPTEGDAGSFRLDGVCSKLMSPAAGI